MKRYLAEFTGTIAPVPQKTRAIVINEITHGTVTHVGIAITFVLKFLFPASVLLGATIPAGSSRQSFILELILTLILMLVIISVATGAKEQGLFAGIAVGSTVGLEAMFAGPICGASMNPAKSLAPALISGELKQVWIYLTAPVLGAISAILIHKIIK